jgi:hypothetical protein
VAPGDDVTINVQVENLGEIAQDFSLVVRVGEELTIWADTVFPNAQANLLLSGSRDVPGTYDVIVEGDLSYSGSFTVHPPLIDVAIPTRTIINPETTTAVDTDGNVVAVSEGEVVITEQVAGQIVVSLPVNLATGSTLSSFEDNDSGVIVRDGEVIIPVKSESGLVVMNIIATIDSFQGTGTSAQAVVSKLRMETPPQEVDLSGDDALVGKVTFSVQADLLALPIGASFKVTPKKTISSDARIAFEKIAQAGGTTVADIGASLKIEHHGLESGSVLGTARIRVGVSELWASQYGTENIKMGRLADDGSFQILDTAVVGQDAAGRTIFEAISPNGFSIFSLMSVVERSADIVATSLEIEPRVVEPDGVVQVTVTLTNEGDAQGSQNVLLLVNAEAVQVKAVTLAPSETVTLIFFLKQIEQGKYTVVVGDLSQTFMVARDLGPASIVLSDLEITPSVVEVGVATNVSVRVMNSGEQDGKFDVVLLVNNVPTSRTFVFLEAGSGEIVNFTILRSSPGDYTVTVGSLVGKFTVSAELTKASISVSDLTIVPPSVHSGEASTVEAMLQNEGQQEGSVTLRLLVNGEEREVKVVVVKGGASLPVKFKLVLEKLGTYEVSLNGLTGSLEVTGEYAVEVHPEDEAATNPLVTILVLLALIGGTVGIAIGLDRKPI